MKLRCSETELRLRLETAELGRCLRDGSLRASFPLPGGEPLLLELCLLDEGTEAAFSREGDRLCWKIPRCVLEGLCRAATSVARMEDLEQELRAPGMRLVLELDARSLR